MILHCEFCSLGGEAIGDHSAIAVIDVDSVCLPLKPESFKALYPENGPMGPWENGVPWERMLCPRSGGRHLAFMVPYDETEWSIEHGGPSRILTEHGFVSVENILQEVEYIRMETANDENRGQRRFDIMRKENDIDEEFCPKCLKKESEFKTRAGFVNHVRLCK